MSDTRAVSVPIQYVLLLAIVALLSGGLYVSVGGFVQDEQAGAAEDALGVIGARLASDLAAADRVATPLDGAGTLSIVADTPAHVAGATYTVTVESTGTPDRAVLVLASQQPAVSVRQVVVTDVPVGTGSVAGGPLRIVYDASADRLEVRHG